MNREIEPQPWVELPEHYDPDRFACPIDGERWPCAAEGQARSSTLQRAMKEAPRSFSEQALIDLLARFHHELGDDWPEHAYADEYEATQEHHRAAARAFLKRHAAGPR